MKTVNRKTIARYIANQIDLANEDLKRLDEILKSEPEDEELYISKYDMVSGMVNALAGMAQFFNLTHEDLDEEVL